MNYICICKILRYIYLYIIYNNVLFVDVIKIAQKHSVSILVSKKNQSSILFLKLQSGLSGLYY